MVFLCPDPTNVNWAFTARMPFASFDKTLLPKQVFRSPNKLQRSNFDPALRFRSLFTRQYINLRNDGPIVIYIYIYIKLVTQALVCAFSLAYLLREFGAIWCPHSWDWVQWRKNLFCWECYPFHQANNPIACDIWCTCSFGSTKNFQSKFSILKVSSRYEPCGNMCAKIWLMSSPVSLNESTILRKQSTCLKFLAVRKSDTLRIWQEQNMVPWGYLADRYNFIWASKRFPVWHHAH